MLRDNTAQSPAALDLITSIANESAKAYPDEDALVKELLPLSHQLLKAEK
jgi:hypothetical protein